MSVEVDKFQLRFVDEVMFRNRIFAKIANAPNDPKITMKATRPNVPYVKLLPTSPKFDLVSFYFPSFSR